MGVLGTLEVTADGESVRVGGARLRALLIRLALDAGRFVSSASLARALWPEEGPADRVHALQALASRLRRLFPEGSLRQGPGGYCLDLPQDAVDVMRFERLAREGRLALREGDPGTAVRRLREALGLWRDAALSEVALMPVAARLHELRLAAIEDRVTAEFQLSTDLSAVVAELEELVAAHPLRERLRGLLIKALHALGRQAEALAAYEHFRVLLAEELGADPGRELQEIHLAVLRGERAAPGGRPRGNLRTPLTSFVGRADERARIAARLREDRLVTLVGPGGVGKSRLATQIARDLAADVPGGVWLVELAPVADPADLPQTLAGALGLTQAGRLADTLPAADIVVVLDNCEHLIDAAARLVEDLLGSCPQLRVLATSREPLGILGEALCPVAPLRPGEGVRLLADRAKAVRAEFAVTDANAADLAEICDRLDGLPLAIELAAARLRYLTVEQLAAGLANRFQMLTGGSRTALPRHRTLRAVVAWSWDLLPDDERRTAERLAVFPGSFTPQAATRVCGHEAVDALADKSLLQFVGGAEPRYRMLETIREYGLERLAETGEITRARAAHAAYFLDLAERAEPPALMAERDSLRAAVYFACDTADADTAVRLAAALGYFWTISEDHAEVAGRLRAVLAVADDAEVAVVYLLNTVLSGELAQAKADAGRFLALARAEGADPASTVLIEAMVALICGDATAGLAAIDEPPSDSYPRSRAMSWFVRSFLDGTLGDMAAMRRDLLAATAAFREAGERWGLAMSLSHLAFAQSTLGDFDESVASLAESIALTRDLGADEVRQVWLSMIRIHTGDVGNARTELLDMVTSNLPAHQLGVSRVLLANLARYDGDLDTAARYLDDAARHRTASRDPSLPVLLQLATAQLETARGDLESARRRLAQALALAEQSRDMPLVALVVVGVAGLRRAAPGAATKLLGAAHALRGGADTRHPDVVRLAHDLHAHLGERYRDAYDRGRRLDRGVALALARAAVQAG
ncbi:BTAD domain-containing putative transcriptional regulator [Streptosporangium soli]